MIRREQFEAVLALDGPKRYRHFIKEAADKGKVWGLYSGGWALAGTAEEEHVFPIWPARDYAEACAVGIWGGYVPREIDLEDLLEGLMPSLHERKTRLGVFYTTSDKGVLPSLEQFEHDLREELAKNE